MANIAIVSWPEAGHTRPTATLARRLVARGHRVVFLGPPDFAPAFDGLDFAEVGAAAFPRGSLGADPSLVLRDDPARYRAFVDAWTPEALRAIAPDVLVVDFLLPVVAFAGYGAGLRVVSLYTNLPYTRTRPLPPLTSTLIPNGSLVTRAKIELAWQKIMIRRAVKQRVLPEKWPFAFLDDAAKKAGYEGGIVRECALACAIRAPELLLCPAELDFPHAMPKNRCYAEPTVDTGRAEPEFAWDKLDARKSLLYCAIGTQSHRYQRGVLERTLGAVVRAATALPSHQLVLAVGDFDASALEPIPENVIVVPTAPQLAMLQRASVMITHSGLNSVKEAILHDVPMIAIPLLNDQAGNAARLAYHGLGAMIDARQITPEQIRRAIAEVEAPRYKAAVARFGAAFRRAEQAMPSSDFLQRVADGLGDRSAAAVR